jgi:hypothetical protein
MRSEWMRLSRHFLPGRAGDAHRNPSNREELQRSKNCMVKLVYRTLIVRMSRNVAIFSIALPIVRSLPSQTVNFDIAWFFTCRRTMGSDLTMHFLPIFGGGKSVIAMNGWTRRREEAADRQTDNREGLAVVQQMRRP